MWACHTLLSVWALWLVSMAGSRFWSLRREVVSSAPTSGASVWGEVSVSSLVLSGDWGELSSRDAISPFWYWERVI